MTKADSPKPPPKLETITLKVFIHCEGCRRKVRRIIRVVDGVEDVTVDSASGKVTVSGTADAKTILQRLQKYGKHAEMWPSSNPAPAAPAKAGGNQPKPSNNNGSDNNSKKKGNGAGDKAPATAENESKKGGVKEEATSTPDASKGEDTAAASEKKPEKSKEGNSVEVSDASTPPQSGGNGGGGNGGGGSGGKKGGKKGGNGNSNNGNSGANAPPAPPSSIPVHDLPVISAPNTTVTVSANKSFAPYDSIQTGYSYHSAEYATHMFSDENANNCSIM